MTYSGAQIIVKMLERRGITTIAGIPGGANLPLYNALYESKTIHHVLARHEQGGGFMAQGSARSTGQATVCFATSGPGATNLMTAIADAKMDSVPVVFITGQVSSNLIGTDAFQEIDTYGMTIPITKHNFLVRSARELLDVLVEAFYLAESGRPGPVLIDVPKDVQNARIEVTAWPEYKNPAPLPTTLNSDVEKIAQLIAKAERPILYVGGGIVQSNAADTLLKLAEKNAIPVTNTLMGLGCFPPTHPLYIGMLGMHGARYTNYLMHRADLVIALGVRFDDRAIGNAKKFIPDASIVHVDIDHSEIDKIKHSNLSVVGDVGVVMTKLLTRITENKREAWISEVAKLREEGSYILPTPDDVFHPINIIKKIAEFVPADTIVSTDVGQHQMWVAQHYPFTMPRTLLTSGGLGTMGFGLPAAIGAALYNPLRKVVCFSGDGSILMNIQELATLAEENLNVAVILMNNGHLGLVRQQQELFYNQNYMASKFHVHPDFATIAKGFNIPAYDLTGQSNPYAVLQGALATQGPVFINIPINFAENVLPMVAPGGSNTEMIGG